MNAAAILAAAERVRAAGPSSPRLARDPVNLPAIRAWTDAIGDANPVYTHDEFAAGSVHGGLVAPPAMIQVWTMPGLGPPGPAGGLGGSPTGASSSRQADVRRADDPLGVMTAELDAAGFTSVVATNCDQTYARYVRPGEQLAVSAELLDTTGPKRTALGEGWFVTTRSTWYSGDEPVARMDFRVLKFRPPDSAPSAAVTTTKAELRGAPGGRPPEAAAAVMLPPVSPDTEFFWAGTRLGELRIQRCGGCGVLRHPPGPACPRCGSIGKAEYQLAAGTGTVYSYVVHHHPPVPGRELPIVVAVVELTEGVRMLGELTGIGPGEVSIGMPVRVSLDRVADDLVLPGWRPDEPGALPQQRVDVTPTFVVATALATRDFYPA